MRKLNRREHMVYIEERRMTRMMTTTNRIGRLRGRCTRLRRGGGKRKLLDGGEGEMRTARSDRNRMRARGQLGGATWRCGIVACNDFFFGSFFGRLEAVDAQCLVVVCCISVDDAHCYLKLLVRCRKSIFVGFLEITTSAGVEKTKKRKKKKSY